jgi:ppGpp synthetase/RelA/SpoT-type nucleotidyltranferase
LRRALGTASRVTVARPRGHAILTACGHSDLGAALDLVDSFLARYVKEYDYYDQVAHKAAQMLRSNLEAAGIRSIVTSRAKSVPRLAEKCRQRNNKRPYESIDDIYSDIVDLAGVRVALYFPGECEQVGGLITRLFLEYDASRVFPDASPPSKEKTFSGYSATHYRVRLRPQDLADSDQRYASANIEIQVASVLMMHGPRLNTILFTSPLKASCQSRSICCSTS